VKKGPTEPIRLAYLVTHPIQYQSPLLRRIAAEPGIHLSVFFATDMSIAPFHDPGFGRRIEWDIPLMDGYEHAFLPRMGSKERISFWQPITYGLTRRLIQGRFHALWVHGYMRWSHWVAMCAAKRLKLKVFVRDEATVFSTYRGPVKRLAKQRFFAWLATIVDRFLAIGSLNANYYLLNGVDPRAVVSMPYAVDNLFFQARTAECAQSREHFRRSLGLMPERPVILYVGKMTARKRPDDLLEAYRRLSADGISEPQPYLVFVGDGELFGQLQTQANSLGWQSVRFVGFRNQTELPAFFDLCNVFAMPSVAEPWGLVVNEVMNAARAVVVSDQVGCVPDLVQDGINGAVFKAGDRGQLASALRRVLADPSECAAMGLRGLQRINRWSFEEDVAGLRCALGI
jgi:glycosyltransferase involved in cell wall biosynthesis